MSGKKDQNNFREKRIIKKTLEYFEKDKVRIKQEKKLEYFEKKSEY